MTIVHAVSSLGVGGMERVVLQLAHGQQALGHSVSVLALKGGPLEAEARERGLKVHILRGGRLSRLVMMLGMVASVRPHVVHVHNPTSLHYAIIAKLAVRARVVVTLHSDQDTHFRAGTPLEWRLTDEVVAVSRAAAATMQLPHATIGVVHNGIAIPQPGGTRHSTRASLGWDDAVIGIIVARISGRKGHRTLIEAHDVLRSSHPAGRLLVVGDGPDKRAVEQLAGDLKLDGAVRFLGARSDVDTLLEAADYFVLPSDFEGLPMSVLEAMAHGLPVIASRVGGIPEVIEHDREGLLVPPADPLALAGAIGQLIADPALRRRLGEAARERVDRDFSLDATLRHYQRLYESARP